MLCLVALHHLSNATALTDTGILQFNTKTVISSICVGTTVKTNQDDGKTEIQFTTYNDNNREGESREKCIPAVKCGILYFPTNTMNLLNHLMETNSNLYSVMMEQNMLRLAVGRRGDLADAIVKGAHDRHRRRSKYLPSAYLLRRAPPLRASAPITEEGQHNNEMFSQHVVSILSLNPEASTLQDRLEILLRDVNQVCDTNFKTARQVWTEELMSVASKDNKDVDHDRRDQDPSYIQQMRSGASASLDARGVVNGNGNSNSNSNSDIDFSSSTPLMIAAHNGNYNLVSQLIKFGADVSLVDERDRTALHWACSSMRTDLRIIQDLSISCQKSSESNLVTKQSCIHARDKTGRTPFQVVLDQLSHSFLEKRPQPNDLLIAARMLLDVGADINTANYQGKTSLMLAASRQIYHAVAFLIQSGADVERKDMSGCTALCHAADWPSWTIHISWHLAKMSSKKKLDVQVQKIMELHSFDEIEKDCLRMMVKFIYGKRKRFKTEIDSSRVTKSLVQCGYLTRSVHALLKGGASLEVIDAVGETPLHKMHPSVIQGILPILSQRQKLELTRMSSVRDHNGLTWEEHISWSTGGIDRGVVGKEKKETSSVEIDSDGNEMNVVARGDDCDFTVVTRTELMQMKLEEGAASRGRTTFEEHFTRWNKPVLVLNFSNEQEEWKNLKDTWGQESWISQMFGRAPVVAGVIPYPEKFDVAPIKRSMQTFLRQIHSYEAKRLKAKELKNKGEEVSVMDARTLSVPPAYLFHNVDMIKRSNNNENIMGHHLLSKLGNFTPSLLPSNRTQLQTAQFYYGNYGR